MNLGATIDYDAGKSAKEMLMQQLRVEQAKSERPLLLETFNLQSNSQKPAVDNCWVNSGLLKKQINCTLDPLLR